MINWRDYDVMIPAESLTEYGDGGLYPIYINDRFQDGRYQILNKLGFGGYSTVWAAQDHQYASCPFFFEIVDTMLVRTFMWR